MLRHFTLKLSRGRTASRPSQWGTWHPRTTDRPRSDAASACRPRSGLRSSRRLAGLALVACLALLASAADASPLPAISPDESSATTSGCTLSSTLVPSCGVMLGAFVQPVRQQTDEQAFRRFERLSQSKMRIVHFYYQGTELFPAQWQIDLADQPGHHRILLVNWKPEEGHTWAQVAAGSSDAYIDDEASYLLAHFTSTFFLVIHHEPENEVNETAGSGYTAEDYAAMYRHVEDRLTEDGVDNAVYVMNYMGAQTYGQQSWFPALWPGDDYVDWIAFDLYSTPDMGGQEGGFSHMMNLHWGHGEWRGAYRWAEQNHPHLPVMLAEWGVGEKPGRPKWKSWFYGTVPTALTRFPNLKAICYFDSPHGAASGDVRPNTSPVSLRGWIAMADNPIFHE